MSFEVIGFDREPLFRWSAMIGAIDEFGDASLKFGVIPDPVMIGQRIVCAKVCDFGAVFRPDEVDRLTRTSKKIKDSEWPKHARRFIELLQGAADDARYAGDAANKVMI